MGIMQVEKCKIRKTQWKFYAREWITIRNNNERTSEELFLLCVDINVRMRKPNLNPEEGNTKDAITYNANKNTIELDENRSVGSENGH